MKIPKNNHNLKCKIHKANLINNPLKNKKKETNLKNSLKHNNKLKNLHQLQRRFLHNISQKKIFMIQSSELRTKSKKISNRILMIFITLKPEPILPNNNINLQ